MTGVLLVSIHTSDSQDKAVAIPAGTFVTLEQEDEETYLGKSQGVGFLVYADEIQLSGLTFGEA